MKKFFLIALCAIFVLSFNNASAKIRRVGFFANQIANQDYTSLQAAHDASNSGDTLLIFPGSWGANFGKKLVVIGYGYYLSGAGADSNLQVITGAVSIGVTLYANSDSSIFEGLNGFTLSMATNLLIKKILISNCNGGLSIDHSTTLQDWRIIKSVFYFYTSPFQGYDTFSNLLLENDIITSCDLTYTNNFSCTGAFNNNIFLSTPNFNNGSYSLYNNIFLSTTTPLNIANCIFDYNIASNNAIPNNAPYSHNKTNVDLSTVFVGYPLQGSYSNDGRWALAAGSAAKGAGEGGIYCGIFGGTAPYKLAGIPPIPSFYKLTAPSNIAESNPYTITFSVRGNN